MSPLRSVFVGLGILVLASLFLTLLMGTTLFVAAAPIVAHEYPTVLADEERACGAPCVGGTRATGFLIPDHANRVELLVRVVMNEGSGPVRVSIHDQQGRTQYDRVFTSGGVESDAASWPDAHGRWTMRTTMAGFMGTFHAQVAARGMDATR